jgi:predicted nucleic acid-binding protein
MLFDSSVILECLFSQPLKDKCIALMRKHRRKCISSLTYYECYKKIASKAGTELAMEAMAFLETFECIDCTKEIMLTAADLSLHHDLAMADSLILATALSEVLDLATLDNDFARINGVTVIR